MCLLLETSGSPLPCDLLGAESLHSLLHDEALNLIRLSVSRKHNHEIGVSSISNPSLHSIEHEASFDWLGTRFQSTCVTSSSWLGESPANIFLKASELRKEFSLLFLTSQALDAPHSHTVLDQQVEPD